MAAATPGGEYGDLVGHESGGESVGGRRVDGGPRSGACSSAGGRGGVTSRVEKPQSPVALTAEAKAAVAFSKAVLASPLKTSQQWSSSFGVVE